MTVCRANDTSVQPQLLHAMGAARSDPRRGSNPMERCNQPPPDDFPRLWGVEDKLGLYIPKQKGVLALEGELDISPRRYLSGELKSLYRLRTGRHTPCSSAAKQHWQLLLPDPHCSPSDRPQRQETTSAHALSAFLREGHGRCIRRSSGADQNHRQTPRGALYRARQPQTDGRRQ